MIIHQKKKQLYGIRNHQSEMAGGFLMYFGRWCDLIVAKVSLEGVSVTGHAGYSESGNDIVCAAVSALVQGLYHSLQALTSDRISCRFSDGNFTIGYEDLSEAGKLLVDSFFIAVSDISRTYGEQFVRIE